MLNAIVKLILFPKLEINMHHLRGYAIPAGPLSDLDEILCR